MKTAIDPIWRTLRAELVYAAETIHREVAMPSHPTDIEARADAFKAKMRLELLPVAAPQSPIDDPLNTWIDLGDLDHLTDSTLRLVLFDYLFPAAKRAHFAAQRLANVMGDAAFAMVHEYPMLNPIPDIAYRPTRYAAELFSRIAYLLEMKDRRDIARETWQFAGEMQTWRIRVLREDRDVYDLAMQGLETAEMVWNACHPHGDHGPFGRYMVTHLDPSLHIRSPLTREELDEVLMKEGLEPYVPRGSSGEIDQ